jgi:hypothetical protein
MEQWWNDTDRRKLKYLHINMSQYHFVHQKSHMELPGIEPGPESLHMMMMMTVSTTMMIMMIIIIITYCRIGPHNPFPVSYLKSYREYREIK